MAQFAVPIAIALVATAAVFILTKPKGTHTKGPRLGDLKVTDSAYGKPIPILRGRGRAGGNIIQASDLREIAHTTKVDGGGKGSSSDSKQTSYTAEVDFALMIGEGEIDKLLRIWFDGKIVFDITGSAGFVRKPGLVFRFYKGTEDQLPDPLIESLVGENLAPAYRGVAYIVFEKLQLADYGNRPPQVTVEYAENSTPLQLFKTLEGDIGTGLSSRDQSLVVNENTRKGYLLRGAAFPWTSSVGDTLIVEFDIDSMLVTRTKLVDDAISLPFPNVDWEASSIVSQYLGIGKYDNRLYICVDPSPGDHVIIPVDCVTLTTSADYQFLPGLLPYLGASHSSLTQVRIFTLLGEEWIFNIFLSAGVDRVTVTRQFPNFVTASILAMDLDTITGSDTFWNQTFTVPGIQSTNEAEIWFGIGGNGSTAFPEGDPFLTKDFAVAKMFCRPTEGLSVQFEPTGGISTYTWGIALSSVDPLAVAWGQFKHLAYSPADDSLIIIIQTYGAFSAGFVDTSTVKTFALKWRNNQVIWSTEVPEINRGFDPDSNSGQVTDVSPSDLSQTLHYTSSTGTIVELDLASGEYTTSSFTAAGSFKTDGVTQFYSPIEESIITKTSSPVAWVKIYLNRASANGVAVADIVRQLSLRAGLQESEFDVTAITGANFEVGGFQATQPSTARANIEPLEVAFSFYSVESDYVIKFIPKDGAIAPVEIAERFLVQDNESDVLEERRVQELDLPAYVGITFMDQDRDYNTGTAQSKRPSNPSSTMLSDNRVEVELPIVWDYTSVKRISQRSLYSAWQERVNYKGRMAWDFLYIDPGEEIIVNLDNGDILPQRIEKQAIGADLVMEFEAVSSDVATYSSTIDGDGGIDPVRKTFSQAQLSRVFVLDMPLLSDTHNPPAGLSMEYYGLAGYGLDDWRGAIMFKSPDNLTWTEIADTVIETAYGTVSTALPDNLDPFATDYSLQIEVFMVTQPDRLQSVTYEQFVNGANAAAIIKGNGEIEVIQFQTVVNEGEGRFTLSTIARGRRGTNVFCGGHVSSELFILLNEDAGIVRTIAVSEIGSPFFYKGVTIGTLLSDAPASTSTTQGNDLKPYMPTHFTATVVATDIQFEWVRNTRIGGALMDGTGDVPLSEDSELYDLEIFDAPGGTVVRTFSSVTAPSQLYLNANIITDFGSIPSTITFKIYQRSALVGRGFSRELTVEVV